MARFNNYCTCGGYAWTMNGRPESQPHMAWCPQREEYAKWYAKQRATDLGGGQELKIPSEQNEQ
jgi:hypothetical protein